MASCRKEGETGNRGKISTKEAKTALAVVETVKSGARIEAAKCGALERRDAIRSILSFALNGGCWATWCRDWMTLNRVKFGWADETPPVQSFLRQLVRLMATKSPSQTQDQRQADGS